MSGADAPEAQPAANPDRPGRREEPREAPTAAADGKASGSADADGKAESTDATSSKPATESGQHAARYAQKQLSPHFVSINANIFNAQVDGWGATFGTYARSGREEDVLRARTGRHDAAETGAVEMPLDDHPASGAREDHPEYSICEILCGKRIVGLGFAIGQDHVATCAHVVNSALGRADKRDPARPGNAEIIWLRFATGSADRCGERRKASVAGWLPARARTFDADDIAVLQLDKPTPAHVRVLRPARYRPSMPVQMWGPQPGKLNGGHVKGEARGKVKSGRFRISVEGGPFRDRRGFSGGPVWEPGTGEAVGVLSACGAKDDATDAYLLEADRVIAVWPGWSTSAPESAHPSLRTRSLVLLTIGLAVIVYALGVVIVRPGRGLSAPRAPHPAISMSAVSSRPPHPTSRSTASSARHTASHSPRPDPPGNFPPTPVPAPSPRRSTASSPSPAVSVTQFRAANPYLDYDPQGVAGSEVVIVIFGCYAWLDNYGSGDLSGAIYADTGSCAGEFFRSGGPAVYLAASYEGERTSPLSDIGHRMRVCVWPQSDQADERCSPWFGMNGDTPVQS
jgi:hypothetical protein